MRLSSSSSTSLSPSATSPGRTSAGLRTLGSEMGSGSDLSDAPSTEDSEGDLTEDEDRTRARIRTEKSAQPRRDTHTIERRVLVRTRQIVSSVILLPAQA